MSGDNRNLRKGRRKLRAIRFYTNRRRTIRPGHVYFVLFCIWAFWAQADVRKATAWIIALAAVYSIYVLRCYTLGKENDQDG